MLSVTFHICAREVTLQVLSTALPAAATQTPTSYFNRGRSHIICVTVTICHASVLHGMLYRNNILHFHGNVKCCRSGLIPRFFEFLSLEHSNNNVHNIRLCRLLIANADLTSVELADMQVADKVMSHAVASQF